MVCTKLNQLLQGDLQTILDKIEADILQITMKWNCKWIVWNPVPSARNIPATNCSSTPKYVQIKGSL